MNYKELKDKHTKEFSEVPIFWAFSNEQFDEGLKKQGIVKGEKSGKFFSLFPLIMSIHHLRHDFRSCGESLGKL